MARGSVNGATNPVNPPPFQESIVNGQTTVISERDRVVLRRSARARRGASMQRPRRTTLAFGITQVILGLAIVGVSFTAFALSTSNRIRNACPYWAGFSVLFTGGVGLIAWKQPSSLAISFFTFLSALCVILHLVATALSGLSCAELQLLTGCTKHPATLVCYCCTSSLPCTPTENAISVDGVKDCSIISSTIRLVMFIICVANIVACLICIAATIVGCAYIVKRHANRRMVLRRPHHTGSIARDSYISDIGGVIDSVFTPPLVPPPPYSPPEYTEISNDPVIIEGPDFLDDLSTPTPVLPIAPHEMPPPYSTLSILPGTTIECSVAQEFQVANEEVSNCQDNRLEEDGDGCLGEGYIPDNQQREQHVPLPPIRWDSHTLNLDLNRTPGLTSGPLALRNGDVINNLSSCERRRRRNNRRRRSPGDGRSGDSDQSGRRRNRNRGNSQTLPLPGRTAMGMQQAPHRTSACLDERRGMIEERIVTGASCEAILPNTVENMWAQIENRNTSVRSFGNHTNGIVNGNEDAIMDRRCDTPEENNVLDNNNERTDESHKVSSNSTSPIQNHSPPSERSPSGSSERLTGGTASSSSRNTRTSSSTQRRQRRRRSSDRRMRTSSSNYSTSSTDHSSKSNGGIRQTARARQQQLFSTSSSSDSDDNTPQRPRRLVARMTNGGVTHEVAQGQSGQSNGPSRSRRHTRGSRNRQRPVSAQPTVGRQPIPQLQPSTNAKPNPKPGTCHERINATHGLSPSSIHFNQQGRVKQRRPDSLDLKLIWSSHRGYIGHQSSLSTSSSADSYDPWIPRDGVTITTNNEKLTVNMAASESMRSKVPQAAPSCIKKKQLHRMAEGKNHLRNNLPVSFQQPDNNTHVRINPSCVDNGLMAEMGLPSSNIEREHVTPEKDIDTTECCNVTENATRDRPKSMVEFNKDTSNLVSEILNHADGDISPAVKTVLQDIHSVIENDDRYLSELWQSACILDKFANKCTNQRNSLQNGIVRFKDNREQDSMEATVSKSEQMKYRHSCPDADDMQRQAEKMLNVSRAELVKSLEDARETIL